MKALYYLFAGKPFEFYTLDTMDNMVFKLHSLQREGHKNWKGRRLKFIDVLITDDYEFTCHQNFGQSMECYCTGRLVEQSLGVRVIGKAKVSAFSKFVLALTIIWTGVWGYITIADEASHMALLGIVFLVLVFGAMIKNQNDLHNTIHHIIGKSKQKNGARNR